MPGRTSGIQQDLRIIKRRSWVFIPFLLLGIVGALVLSEAQGTPNAVANMEIETVIQDLTAAGTTRGFGAVNAEAMTHDPAFIEKVIAATGDPDFDYMRYDIFLAILQLDIGYSRGIVTVTIEGEDAAETDRLRSVFVDVFTEEFTSPDGLFRARFANEKFAVADTAARQFQDAYERIRPELDELGLSIDQLLQGGEPGNIETALNLHEAALRTELAQVNAALATPETARSGAQATVILRLETAVADGDAAEAALEGRATVLTGAINEVVERRAAISDTGLEPELRKEVLNLRASRDARDAALVRAANAAATGAAGETTVSVAYQDSGGVASSTLGRVGVVIAVTLIFGVIAIYVLEWLSQVRSRSSDEDVAAA